MSAAASESHDFGAKAADRDARRYPQGAARHRPLARGDARGRGRRGRSVLEIGGGIGGLQIELLEAGAERDNVEIIDTYERVAEALIAEHGLGGRVERRSRTSGLLRQRRRRPTW